MRGYTEAVELPNGDFRHHLVDSRGENRNTASRAGFSLRPAELRLTRPGTGRPAELNMAVAADRRSPRRVCLQTRGGALMSTF